MQYNCIVLFDVYLIIFVSTVPELHPEELHSGHIFVIAKMVKDIACGI